MDHNRGIKTNQQGNKLPRVPVSIEQQHELHRLYARQRLNSEMSMPETVGPSPFRPREYRGSRMRVVMVVLGKHHARGTKRGGSYHACRYDDLKVWLPNLGGLVSQVFYSKRGRMLVRG